MTVARMLRPLALALSAALAGWQPAFGAGLPVDLELVLAVDVSGSIDPEEARMQRDGYVAALVDPLVLRAVTSGGNRRIAVAYFEWAQQRHKRIIADWALVEDRASAEALAARIAAAPITIGMQTSISGAIEFAMPMFGSNAFEGARRVIDISGDGPNNEGPAVDLARDAAVARGITINGLPILNERPNRFGFPTSPDLDQYYRGCVIGGTGAFIVVAHDFAAFAAAIKRKLVLEIAGEARRVATLKPLARPAHPWQPMSATPAPGLAAARMLPLPQAPSRRRLAEFYEPGCDIGERQSREYFRSRYFQD